MAKIKIDFGGANEKLRAEIEGRAVNGEILVDLPAEREWFKRMVSDFAFTPAAIGEVAGKVGFIFGTTVFVTIPQADVLKMVKEFKREILEEN